MSTPRIVPIDQLRATWPRARSAVDDIRQRTDQPWLVEDVYADLLSGQALLLMRDDESAIAVVKRDVRQYPQAPTLLVWLAWSSPGSADILADQDWIRQLARELGCQQLAFESPRAGWERRAPALGWRAEHTRWVLEA
jgi:hypothetical protein